MKVKVDQHFAEAAYHLRGAFLSHYHLPPLAPPVLALALCRLPRIKDARPKFSHHWDCRDRICGPGLSCYYCAAAE